MKRMLVVNSGGRDFLLFDHFAAEFSEEWAIEHVINCNEVDSLLSKNEFDVVVAVVNDDVELIINLFSELKKTNPKILRFVLTNQVSERKVINALDAISAYFNQEIKALELYSSLERNLMIEDIVNAEKFLSSHGISDSLPSMPSLYADLIELLNTEEASIKEISALMKRDPAMTTKLIQLVNSSFFGLRRAIVSAEDAAVMIGIEPIKALVLSEQSFKLFKNRKIPSTYVQRLWNHSTMVAAFSRCIARYEGADKYDADTAFTAGMIHDIGKLIMLEYLPDDCLEYAGALTEDTYESLDVERMVFGTTHPNVAGLLLSKWGFTNNLLEPVIFHHKPLWLHKEFSPLQAVFAADCFYHEFFGHGDESSRLGTVYNDCHSIQNKAHKWKDACHSLIV